MRNLHGGPKTVAVLWYKIKVIKIISLNKVGSSKGYKINHNLK
jgi:hypothetical protein